MLILVPLGIAASAAGPMFQDTVQQIGDPFGQYMAQLQQQLGIYNPAIAQVNEQLAKYGTNAATIGAGLAIAALGLGTIAALAAACAPDGSGSSGSSR